MKYTKEINDILVEWNPLEVPDVIASQEYISYIPQIRNNLKDISFLKNYLEKIINEEFGYEIDSNMRNEIEKTCQKLVNISSK